MSDFSEPVSQERLEEAVTDAKLLLDNSVVTRAMINLRMIGLRLVKLADAHLAYELGYCWDVNNEREVMTVLTFSALESVAEKQDSATELQRDVMEVLHPILHGLVIQEEI